MLLICLLATILQGIIALDSTVSHQKDEFTNNTIGETSIDDFILCRNCGADLTPINFLINDSISPLALSISNITISGKLVVVQEVRNPYGRVFKIVILKRANCSKVVPWHSESSWFPGYFWKLCLCTRCSVQLGWQFEPAATATLSTVFPSDQGFYALILDNFLAESYVNSLLMKEVILHGN